MALHRKIKNGQNRERWITQNALNAFGKSSWRWSSRDPRTATGPPARGREPPRRNERRPPTFVLAFGGCVFCTRLSSGLQRRARPARTADERRPGTERPLNRAGVRPPTPGTGRGRSGSAPGARSRGFPHSGALFPFRFEPRKSFYSTLSSLAVLRARRLPSTAVTHYSLAVTFSRFVRVVFSPP